MKELEAQKTQPKDVLFDVTRMADAGSWMYPIMFYRANANFLASEVGALFSGRDIVVEFKREFL